MKKKLSSTNFKTKKNKTTNEYICKGLFFRGYNRDFFTEDDKTNNLRFEQQRGYRLLKKISCKRSECGSCDSLLDMLYEESTQENGTGEIKNGALYKLVCKSSFSQYANEWEGELFFQEQNQSNNLLKKGEAKLPFFIIKEKTTRCCKYLILL